MDHLIISQDIVVTVTEEMSYLLCDAHYITFECSFIELYHSRNGEERCSESVLSFRAALDRNKWTTSRHWSTTKTNVFLFQLNFTIHNPFCFSIFSGNSIEYSTLQRQ